jgi:hypothetical protein
VTTLAVAIAIAAASSGASAVALLLRRLATAAAWLMVAAGAAGLAAALLLAADRRSASGSVGIAAAGVLAPLALTLYPVARWRHPADFLAVVVLAGCGIVATAYGEAEVVGMMALVQGCVFLAHTWWRVETSQDRERRALVWMVLALIVTGLAYFFASFSAEGTTSGTLPRLATVVFALVGPAMYVGVTLPDLVDVRGLVVKAVVTTVALVTVMSVFVFELGLLDALGAENLNTGALGLVAALAATTYHPTRVVLRGVVD